MKSKSIQKLKVALFAVFFICFAAALCLLVPIITPIAQGQGATIASLSDEGFYSSEYLKAYSYGEYGQEGISLTYETNASSYPGNGIANAFDNKWNTFWEAGKDATQSFKPNVTVTFSENVTLDRIIYACRQDGAWGKGFPLTLNIYVSEQAEGEDFTLAATCVSNVISGKALITLDEEVTLRRIRMEFAEVYSSDRKLASAAEIIFLMPEEACVRNLRGIFADYNMLTFREGVTGESALNVLSEVKATVAYSSSNIVKTIADRVELVASGGVSYDADREFSTAENAQNIIHRRGDIAGYARNSLKMVWMGTNRQATGIATEKGTTLTIFVDCEEGDPLPTLTFTQHIGLWSKWYRGGYTLARGINVITAPDLYDASWSTPTNPGGPIYLVNPYTDEQQSANVKIYIEGGYTFPIFRSGDNEGQYKSTLESYVTDYEANSSSRNDLTEIVSDNAVLTVTATAAERYLVRQGLSVEKMCGDIDAYLKELYAFAGVSFDENNEFYDERGQYLNVNIRVMQPYAAAYAFTEHVGIQRGGWENELFTGGGKYGWGLTHELGHMMDISERTRSEHTNNMWSQFNKCALLGESARGTFSSFLAATVKDGTPFEERKAYANFDGDAFTWWLIESRYPGFWGNFENAYRYGDRKGITSACELHVYFASIAAGSDLSEYFSRIGFNWGGVQFKGYSEASEQFKTAIDEAYAEGRIDRDNLKLWYGNADSYNYTAKYGNTLAIYDGSQNISVKAFATSGGVALVMPANNDKGHLGYEILRRGEDGTYSVIGFTYGAAFTDTSEGAESASYKVRAYDRLLGSSALSGAVSADSFAARVNDTDYRTLSKAFAAASDGDIVYLLADAADGQITVDKNLTLKPYGGDRTLYISGSSHLFSVSSGATLTLSGDGDNILKLDGSGTPLSQSLLTVSGTVNILSGTRIENCVASGNGGVIRIPGGTLNVDGAVFANNSGDNGGVIVSLTASSKIDILNAQFTGNVAKNHGGVIYANCTVNVSSSSFNDNVAANGGAISITGGGILSVNGCTFSNNSASAEGGALRLDGKTTFGGETSGFYGNSARNGGAVYVASSNEGRRATISCATFRDNTAEVGSAVSINGYGSLGGEGTSLSIAGGYSSAGDIFIPETARIEALKGTLDFDCSIYSPSSLAFGDKFNAAESRLKLMFVRDYENGGTVATFAVDAAQTDIFAAAYVGDKLCRAELSEDGLNLNLSETAAYLIRFTEGQAELIGQGQTITLPQPTDIPEGKIFKGWKAGEKLFAVGEVNVDELSAYAERGVITFTAVYEDVVTDGGEGGEGNQGGSDNSGNTQENGADDGGIFLVFALGAVIILLVAAVIFLTVKNRRGDRRELNCQIKCNT